MFSNAIFFMFWLEKDKIYLHNKWYSIILLFLLFYNWKVMRINDNLHSNLLFNIYCGGYGWNFEIGTHFSFVQVLKSGIKIKTEKSHVSKYSHILFSVCCFSGWITWLFNSYSLLPKKKKKKHSCNTKCNFKKNLM